MVNLHDFQTKVGGCRQVLVAPTGAGKHIASVHKFLSDWQSGKRGKLIYVVPMKVLASQFYVATSDLIANMQIVDPPRLAVQTGDQGDDPSFEADVIFCTVDQLLSSYLIAPYALPRRQANINFGAIVGAYIVFDEFHLLDPASTLPTTLYLIKQLSKIAPVLLMTATFSTSLIDDLAREFNAETVVVGQEEADRIITAGGTKAMRERTWHTVQEQMNAASVLRAHNKRSIVICNTVDRARAMYRRLKRMTQKLCPDTRIILLHSRFLKEDRARIESDIRALFARGQGGYGSAILVATQVVEVGLDITSERLHTELAPAQSLIQRAGRCARYAEEQADVFVYKTENGAPYSIDNPLIARQMEDTFSWLTGRSGQVLNFSAERDLIDAVSTHIDRMVIDQIRDGESALREQIINAQTGSADFAQTKRLIRDADSRLLIIHPDPASIENPYAMTSFSLDPSVLRGLFTKWAKREGQFGWRVMVARQEEQLDAMNKPRYVWTQANRKEDLDGAAVIAVNSALAGYDAEEGFVPERSTGWMSTEIEKASADWSDTGYVFETYAQHIACVVAAMEEACAHELSIAGPALEARFGWPQGAIKEAARISALLHDVGKLSTGWQQWARAYQAGINKPMASGMAAAHTEYYWRNPNHKKSEREAGKRRTHAVESARACTRAIIRLISDKSLVSAVLGAIARHHGPHSSNFADFKLVDDAASHIAATGIDINDLVTEDVSREDFGKRFAAPGDEAAWLAYCVIVRALRRADQIGTANGIKQGH